MGVASAAVMGLGGAAAVALGGDGGPSKYVAVGAAGAPSAPGDSVAPTGKVRLVPLDPDPAQSSGAASDGGDEHSGSTGGDGDTGSGSGAGATDSGADDSTDSGDSVSSGSEHSSDPSRSPDSGGSGGGNSPGSSAGSTPAQQQGGSAPSPAGPAALKVSEAVLKDADKRWCQDVTLTLRNSGGSAVRSGSVTFGTHVIGSLGIDWATVESTEELPVPIGAGEKKEKTWNVCVDSWRVPLGMHVETRDVSVKWK